jgi:peptidyl-prolyl cis-trans isomerase A (cyclophilin A)
MVKHAEILAFTATLLLAAATSAAEPSTGIVRVRMITSEGGLDIDVFVAKAPQSSNNFLRYVDGGHYDGAHFYRTVTAANDKGKPVIEVIQGGLGGSEAPFAPISHESTSDTGVLHQDGTISMARDEPGSASSEFFICIGAQPGLDHGALRNPDRQGFAAFGRVVSGMETARRIHRLPADGSADSAYVEGQILGEPVLILSVRRLIDADP